MRLHRCYHPESIDSQSEITLTPEVSHHLSAVLRVRIGQTIEVFDGQQAFMAQIVEVGKRVRVRVDSLCEKSIESPLYLHLAQSIAKADKIDWVIQKAVELGVSEITLLLTERSEIRRPEDDWHKKMHHWQGIIIHAVQQSGRIRVPRLNKPITIDSFLTTVVAAETGLKCILHPGSMTANADVLARPFDRATLLIGPEGGFSDKELGMAEQVACQPLTLGPRVLRTETAPIAMLSVLQYVQGDFS